MRAFVSVIGCVFVLVCVRETMKKCVDVAFVGHDEGLHAPMHAEMMAKHCVGNLLWSLFGTNSVL